MKIAEAACVCDDVYKKIVSLGVRDLIAFLSMLTVRVVVLEYNQLHKKA